MSENSEAIYIWSVGDVAVAWLSKKTYAKVTVVKDNRGRFHGDKVLGLIVEKDGTATAKTELCYFVETWCTKKRLWIPWTALRLAERCRPFYGPKDRVVKPSKDSVATKKTSPGHNKKTKMDPLLPFNVKPDHYKTPEFNAKYDNQHVPLQQGKHENSFREFVRRGKEVFFDTFYLKLTKDQDTAQETLYYLNHVNASTEDKFDLVIRDIMTEREIEDYLHQCWRYHFVHKQMPAGEKNGEEGSDTVPRKIISISWCLVCGGMEGRLRVCPKCPATFHLACRKEWLIKIIHRKNPPKKTPYKEALIKSKILSSTRTLVTSTNILSDVAPCPSCMWGPRPGKKTTYKEALIKSKILSSTRTLVTSTNILSDVAPCPSCMWGPRPGYDDVVWHKLGTCSWWPARVLTPGDTPQCLLSRSHAPQDYPLRYYGTLNHAWARSSQMALFLPSHTGALEARDPVLRQAVMDAADDYISVYLT